MVRRSHKGRFARKANPARRRRNPAQGRGTKERAAKARQLAAARARKRGTQGPLAPTGGMTWTAHDTHVAAGLKAARTRKRNQAKKVAAKAAAKRKPARRKPAKRVARKVARKAVRKTARKVSRKVCRKAAKRRVSRRPVRVQVRRNRKYKVTLRSGLMKKPYKRVTKRYFQAKAARKRSKRRFTRIVHGTRTAALGLHRRMYVRGKRGLSKRNRRMVKKFGLTRINPSMGGIMQAIKDLPSFVPQAAAFGVAGVGIFWAGLKLAKMLADKFPVDATTGKSSLPKFMLDYKLPIATGSVTVAGYVVARMVPALSKFSLAIAAGGLAATLVQVLFFKHGAQAESLAAGWTKMPGLSLSVGDYAMGDYAMAPMGDYAMAGLGAGVFQGSTLGALTDGSPNVDEVVVDVGDEGVLAGGIFD